jgi:hypothetical protein
MRHRPLLFVSAAGLLASGCASSPSTPRETAAAVPSRGGWTGTFQATQERTGVLAPTRLQQASGTVRLRASDRDPQRTSVSLVVSTAVRETTSLRWAVLPGRCGAGSLPLLGFDQFAPLDITSSGRGQLEVEIPLALPESGTYHVNVYHRGTQLENVVTCATLRRA